MQALVCHTGGGFPSFFSPLSLHTCCRAPLHPSHAPAQSTLSHALGEAQKPPVWTPWRSAFGAQGGPTHAGAVGTDSGIRGREDKPGSWHSEWQLEFGQLQKLTVVWRDWGSQARPHLCRRGALPLPVRSQLSKCLARSDLPNTVKAVCLAVGWRL